ncbi:SH3 domain-containing protein [Haloferula sp. BvORR071]|uniref:SH3 domain-containing protein n=1 Tax=Haloferula sp. BvORR071 TaxID=1396141 RepID=UPI00055857D9|nr:SH3 domain-containing protein [Haloferula sp. BvORR071]
MLVEVATPYSSQYPVAIRFEAGEPVAVERADPEYPGWFWCRARSGGEGWVHCSFLNSLVGEAIALDAYSARELTAMEGERGTLIHLLDGWACVRLHRGEQGWLPGSHLRMLEAR